MSPLSVFSSTCFIASIANFPKNLRLRETNARLDLANDLILVRDLDDRITYWNPACQKAYGWTAQEAIGQPVHRLLRTEFPESLFYIQNTFLRCGEWRGELVQYTKDDRRLIVSSTWSLHRDEKGRPLANLEINKDITEAKLAEATLRKSERLYRTLVENFPNGAVFCSIATCAIRSRRERGWRR